MLWKILLLVAAIVAVLYGFRYMNRAPARAVRRAQRKAESEAERGSVADGQAVDLAPCETCGAFITPGEPCRHCNPG